MGIGVIIGHNFFCCLIFTVNRYLMVIAACVKVFLAHGRLNTHKQSNCWRGTCLASAPGHRRGKKKNGPGRHRDNGRCVQSALTSRTLRDTPPARKHSGLRAGGGLDRLHSAPASVTLSMHPVAVSAASQARFFFFFYCRRLLSLTRALSLSLNLRSCVTFSWISQHHNQKEKKKSWVPVFVLKGHRTLINAKNMEVCEHFFFTEVRH